MNPDKVLDSIDIVIESLHRPDENLRSQAHDMKCYDELMVVRQRVINNLEQDRKDIKLIQSLEKNFEGMEDKMQQYFELIYLPSKDKE